MFDFHGRFWCKACLALGVKDEFVQSLVCYRNRRVVDEADLIDR
jgi:hypothetical protein